MLNHIQDMDVEDGEVGLGRSIGDTTREGDESDRRDDEDGDAAPAGGRDDGHDR
jgi:hypothetical protein